MDPEDGLDAEADTRDVRIRGSRLLLRALRPGEIEEEWRAMVTADPMVIAELPQEAAFKARLQRSGHLKDGWLDLAIDLDGVSIGRIQTFVPPGRALPRGTFEVGIELREKARNQGYGREALALLTDWLFEQAAAEVVRASTDPANVAMRTVFQRVGWTAVGSLTEFGREWVMYSTSRREWEARQLLALCSAGGCPRTEQNGMSVYRRIPLQFIFQTLRIGLHAYLLGGGHSGALD
jgi:RimJ/RimL family protein N-acetyltransferase